jgi:hypothetical protein
MPSSSSQDPELDRQLTAAEKQNEPVSAVFFLRPGRGGALGPASTKTKVASLLKKAASVTGETPLNVTTYENLGSFAVEARPKLIRYLSTHHDVSSATANVQSQDLLIRPVDRKPASMPRARPTKRKKK